MVYDRETAKKGLPEGWSPLVDDIFEVAEVADVQILFLLNNGGRIAVRSKEAFTGQAYVQIINLERDSSETCMHCGRFGRLRTGTETTILCEDCNDAGITVERGQTKSP